MFVLMDRMKALIASSLTRNSKRFWCRNGERISQRSGIFYSEVQTGSYLGEDDIIRIEDDYSAREAASVPFVASTSRRRKRDQQHVS
jgi:hypothetical protein